MVLKLLVLLLIPIAAFLTSFLGILSFISPPEFTSFPQVLSSYINTCSCVPPLRVWIRGCLCDGFITCKALWISPGWKTVFAQDPCPHDIIWEAFSQRTLWVHVSVVSAPQSEGNPCVPPNITPGMCFDGVWAPGWFTSLMLEHWKEDVCTDLGSIRTKLPLFPQAISLLYSIFFG